ncbi:hypothetical protein NMY22_g12405 [Coprinellus aureogranulatus]|nr:hypothetical protein NMY22_g12405 [Coprinellus aureogranulatus]
MVLSTEGTVPFVVDGEEFQTWYRVYGKLTDSSLPPLIAIHGGPGLVSYYLTPLGDLAKKNELQPVIIYDQLGNGRSSHVPDKPVEFFTIKLYIDELENLIAKIGIKEYHLIGHSWGGPLAAELEVQRKPEGMKSIIFTNSLAEMSLASRSMRERVETLENKEEVLAAFAKGFADPEGYRKATLALHSRYALKYVKEDPLPDDLEIFDWVFGNEEKGIEGDITVSVKMEASRNWSMLQPENRIELIPGPVLVITATDDMIQGYASAPFLKAPHARKEPINFKQSSHLPFWEQREEYMSRVEEWLKEVNAKEQNPL